MRCGVGLTRRRRRGVGSSACVKRVSSDPISERFMGCLGAVVTGPSKGGLFSGGGGLFRGLFRAGR